MEIVARVLRRRLGDALERRRSGLGQAKGEGQEWKKRRIGVGMRLQEVRDWRWHEPGGGTGSKTA